MLQPETAQIWCRCGYPGRNDTFIASVGIGGYARWLRCTEDRQTRLLSLLWQLEKLTLWRVDGCGDASVA